MSFKCMFDVHFSLADRLSPVFPYSQRINMHNYIAVIQSVVQNQIYTTTGRINNEENDMAVQY